MYHFTEVFALMYLFFLLYVNSKEIRKLVVGIGRKSCNSDNSESADSIGAEAFLCFLSERSINKHMTIQEYLDVGVRRLRH